MVSPTVQVRVKDGVVSEVMLSVLLDPVSDPAVRSGVVGALGATPSTVTERDGDADPSFPAGSWYLMVMVWAPSERADEVIVYAEEAQSVVPRSVAPS